MLQSYRLPPCAEASPMNQVRVSMLNSVTLVCEFQPAASTYCFATDTTLPLRLYPAKSITSLTRSGSPFLM